MNNKKEQSINNLEDFTIVKPKKRNFEMLVTKGFYEDWYGRRAHEPFTSELLIALSHHNALFIDVGAHYGYYTLLMGTSRPNCKVVAFEPNPENIEILKLNVALNGLKNVELHNLAASNREELRKFWLTERSSRSSLYEQSWENSQQQIEVRTVCLDRFLQNSLQLPTIVKVDAEGHEPYVIRGMTRFLTDAKDVKLIIEFNPRCLRSAGYEPSEFLSDVFQLGFDIFFINEQESMTSKIERDTLDKWNDYLPGGDKDSSTNMLCIKKQSSLSVLFFCPQSQVGGADKSLFELIRTLIADYGVICSVVLPHPGPLVEKLEGIGASTLIIGYHWWCGFNQLPDEEVKDKLSESFINIFNKLGELRKINPDVVLTNTLVIPWAAVVASFLGKPHVWFVREFGELDYGLKFFAPFQTILEMVKDSSNLIFVNSNAVRNKLFGEPAPHNILTIYPYVDMPSGALLQDEKNYFSSKEVTRLIIVGGVQDSKGQKDAILAVKELIQRKRDVELIIMGGANPEYIEQLKEIIKVENLQQYVNFIDFKENPYPLVDQADISLVCSRSEAFGRVTLEAMLLKKPVIGTNTGGTPELIKEGLNGLLYTPGDYLQLADKIDFLIQGKENIKKFGENGYQFAMENFNKEKSVGKVADHLSQIKCKTNPWSGALVHFTSQVMLDALSNLTNAMKTQDSQINELGNVLMDKDNHINELHMHIQRMQYSIVMRLVNKYQNGVEKLIRPGTKIRLYYEFMLSGIRIMLNEGWRGFRHEFIKWYSERKSLNKDTKL